MAELKPFEVIMRIDYAASKGPEVIVHAERVRELVRCKECIHFTQSGWCDREFDWFPVDENDFCSMAEKMEAQDGQ